MSPSGCDFLNQDHPLLRSAPTLRVLAVHALLEAALRCSVRFCLEFDRTRLLQALGAQSAAELLPGLPPSSTAAIERHGAPLDDESRQLLRRVLSFEQEMWTDPPINYIERVLLFDAAGKIVLRANDNAESILFRLPGQEREHLIDSYRVLGIPEDVFERLNVDINQGI